MRRGAVLGGGKRSQVEGSGLRWKQSEVEGSDRWWRGAVSSEEERSQVEGSGLRWRGAITGGWEWSMQVFIRINEICSRDTGLCSG